MTPPDRVFASVVVPTRGRPRELARALSSLVAQDRGDWEALVVDDGAGEGIEAAGAFGDPRIAAFASPGTGQVDARAAGLERARGEVVCWLDDDDWWDDPRHLSVLHEAASERRPGFWFRGGWIVRGGGAREVFDHEATARSLRRNNTVLTSSIAYPRAHHDRLGPLDRALGGYCDWDFMLRMCDAGLEPRKLPGLGVCYAIHDGNESAAFDAPARREGFERFARKHGLQIELANHVRIHRRLVSAGWAETEAGLERVFEFEDFAGSIAFVNRVAELAESENHHPDVDVRWNKVTLRWITHSAGGITDRDRELAARSAELV